MSDADRLRARLRRAGQISFWFQAILGVLSTFFWVIALVGQLSFGGVPIGATAALWTTFATLLTLALSCLLTFRYWRSGVTQQLRLVLLASLLGAFLAVISSSAQIGELLASAAFRRTLVGRSEEWGLLLAITNTNVTLAHLISLTCILWIRGIFDRGDRDA